MTKDQINGGFVSGVLRGEAGSLGIPQSRDKMPALRVGTPLGSGAIFGRDRGRLGGAPPATGCEPAGFGRGVVVDGVRRAMVMGGYEKARRDGANGAAVLRDAAETD